MIIVFAHVAQSEEHFLGKEEVVGSIPTVGLQKVNYLERKHKIKMNNKIEYIFGRQ